MGNDRDATAVDKRMEAPEIAQDLLDAAESSRSGNGAAVIQETEKRLKALLQGQIPEKLPLEHFPPEEEGRLAETVNQLIEFMSEIQSFIFPLSQGILKDIKIQPKNFLGSPFKELHSRLMHLTWQTERIAQGDYSQRVDFMGDFSEAFNSMVISLEQHEIALKEKITELEQALLHIKHLEGFLPICSHCKKIRLQDVDPLDQKGWVVLETYIQDHSDAVFTHSLCPKCLKEFYPDLDEP
jgi:hypothetical protein